MVIVLVEGDLQRVAQLRAMAEAAPISLEEMRVQAANAVDAVAEPTAQHYAQTVEVDEHDVTFTVEHQSGDVLCRHASFSSRAERRPNIHLVMLLMHELGFTQDIRRLASHGLLWFEEMSNGRSAANVLEPMEFEEGLTRMTQSNKEGS